MKKRYLEEDHEKNGNVDDGDNAGIIFAGM